MYSKTTFTQYYNRVERLQQRVHKPPRLKCLPYNLLIKKKKAFSVLVYPGTWKLTCWNHSLFKKALRVCQFTEAVSKHCSFCSLTGFVSNVIKTLLFTWVNWVMNLNLSKVNFLKKERTTTPTALIQINFEIQFCFFKLLRLIETTPTPAWNCVILPWTQIVNTIT